MSTKARTFEIGDRVAFVEVVREQMQALQSIQDIDWVLWVMEYSSEHDMYLVMTPETGWEHWTEAKDIIKL